MGLNADMVLVNGKIITVDEKDSVVEAVAIREGKFVAVGSSDDIKRLAGDGTLVVDLKGGTAMPGIIDSHTHPSHIAAKFLQVDCRAPPVRNIPEILAMFKTKAKELCPGKWVQGANFNDSKLEEWRHITRWELDEVAPDNPVILTSDTGHQCIVNSRALEVAKITRDTPDPPGGELERDGEGELTGLLYENATALIHDHIPPYTVDELRESYRNVVKQLSEWGVTSTHNASSHRNGIRAYKQLLDEGVRQLRMNLMMSVNSEEPGDVLDALVLAGIESGFGDDWLKV
ncbi:amidohydrolase family protein, partial [Candidatus Bathyarchaeota archaeon]|nr:amidohydrolase family protein [Candidatus Bathyarchaeota archaeon]